MITKRQRVEAVLRGERPDRAPVSCWYHFGAGRVTGQPAVDAHLEHFERYDLDFLKVMNDHHFPRVGFEVVQSVDDLRRLRPVPGDSGEHAGQLDVLQAVRKRLGNDVLTCTTMFNAWSTLRLLTAPPTDRHSPPRIDGGADVRDETLTRLLKEDRSAVQAALAAIGETLADFARLCAEAGAFGVFLSVRDDWVNRPANGDIYDELVRPTDLRILGAVAAASLNMLHVCGRPLDFRRFAEYPVHAIHWADRVTGPSIAYARDRVKPAIAGGVDNLKTLVTGTPEDCAHQVRDALRQAAPRPMIIAPGCTFDPGAVPEANLRAMVEAVRES